MQLGTPTRNSIAHARYVAALLFATAFLSGGVAAEDSYGPSLRPDIAFGEHLHRQFFLRHGLPSNWIYDIVQTRNGYVWIATQNGVVKYDGLRFKVFNRSNTPQLPANDTRVLYESRDGSLWIGTIGGLARYKTGRPGTFEEFDTFRGNSIHAIYEDRDGKLWLGTREETWAMAAGGDFKVADGAPADVIAICQDQHGTFWFGSNSGLYMRRETTVERIAHPLFPIRSGADSGVPPAGVNVLLAKDHGDVWIGANSGLLRMKDDRVGDRRPEIGRSPINDIVQTRNGGLYLATRYGLRRSVDGGEFERLPSDELASCIMEDREGGLWIGYAGGGLHYYRNAKTRALLTDERINCVHEDSEGNMWFGSYSGLHRLRDGQITHYGTEHGLSHEMVQTIAQGRGDSLWIGTQEGLSKWSGKELSTVVAPSNLPELNIAIAFEDSAGVLWLALRSRGGYVLKDGALERLQTLEHGTIKWFHEDSSGNLWIGHEYGLFRHFDGPIEHVTDPAFDRLNNSHFTCFYAANDGTLWIGSAGGIVRYQSGRFDVVTSEDGLAADYVDRMVADNHGNLWLGGRDGLFYVNMSELNQVATGKLQRVVSHSVEPIKAVPVSGFHPKDCLATDGTMWVVGTRGVIYVSPEPLPTNLVPPSVYIEHVSIDGKTVRADRDCEFLSGSRRLAISFAAPTFVNPREVLVKYRLDGQDADWTEAGDERIAYYTDLRPGSYTFRVTARNGDGVWSDEDTTLVFTVRPQWWETTWFRASAAIGLIALSIISTWGYTHHVRQRNAVLRKEIGERKRAETRLRRSESRFRDLAESTQAIPWEADATTFQFTFVGRQAVDVVGYAVEDWLEKDFWVEKLHPEDRLEAVEFCRRASTRFENYQFEYRMIVADGAIVWIHDVVHVVRKDGVPKKLIGFMIDITARRKAEEEARDYLSQLARINRAASMGEMATSIAHEVNQPLFAIVSNAQTAKRLLDRQQPDIEEVRDALSDIIGDGNRAASIIKHIRALVRKEQQPTEQLDLNQVALEAIQFVGPEIRQRGLSLQTDLAHQLPPLRGNSIELQQVILNLIINGAQAMRDIGDGPRELLLTTSAQNGFVELAVKDHGAGFDEEMAERLFEPFFTTKPQGTGMGLAINRTIIEAHGGRIWATRNDGRGATFHFRLPATAEAVA